MAYAGEGLDLSIPAAADLSSYQYRNIIVDANGRGTIATGTATAILGILQNKPSAQDQTARVRFIGESKGVFCAAANESAWLTSNAEGFMLTAGTAGPQTVGIVKAAPGGSGDVQTVIVRPGIYFTQ